MSLLYSLVLDLVAEEDAAFPPTQGHHAHALLLGLIREVDPELATRLHGPGPKPFTASSLLRSPIRVHGGWHVRRGERYALRFTVLDEEVFAKFLSALLQGEVRALRLGNARFSVSAIHTTPSGSSWAGVSSFEQVWEETRQLPHCSLVFCSPTAFQISGNHSRLFPEPSLVFSSLAARWNSFSPLSIRGEDVEQIASATLVSRYRLETRVFDFGRYRKIGFVGECHYELRLPDDNLVRMANALAAFAFFSGVGYKTTMGMGQTRPLVPK